MPEPEALARIDIDRLLEQAGWVVQDRDAINLFAGAGVAIREVSIPGAGEADYLLVAGRKAVGIVEAKSQGTTLTGVETQTRVYAEGLPDHMQAWGLPLPMLYESTGKETRFTNLLEPEPRSRNVFSFHRPEALIEWARKANTTPGPNGHGIGEEGVGYDTGKVALAGRLQNLPDTIDDPKLWPAQREAIANLERSLKENRPRALIQMATGSGKTFTAISSIYRLVRYADAKRVLFLVDRANLGRQTYNEFQQYTAPDDGRKFTELYNVQHLTSNTIQDSAKVCISTIQRIYSILSGDEEIDEALEEGSLFESDTRIRQPKAIGYNPDIPIETFDIIVIDEAHRSIFNLWRQVLDYFDAYLIGLTATPNKQAFGFFNQNLVMEYTHEDAVIDNVNVPFDVYPIRTKITTEGSTVDAGYQIDYRDKKTREVRWLSLDTDTKGDAYEGLLERNAQDTKGGAGQYFTPRPLIDAIVDCIRPQPGETIHDPAAGTAGFLLSAHRFINENYRLDRDEKTHLRMKALHGTERVAGVARLAAMNLLLHGVGPLKGDEGESPMSVTDSLLSRGTTRYDVVLTNPPFGKKSSVLVVNQDGEQDRDSISIVRDDFIATTSNKQLNFLQHVKSILKVNGRAAVVVPDNVLFEGGAGETIRRDLLKTADVHTLLRLPTGIFYAQGVKANVLFFDVREASERSWTKKLWIYDLRTNTHFTLKTKQLQRADLDEFVQCYNPENREDRTETWSEENLDGRWRCYDYEELTSRDKANLDIFWLRDESLDDAASLEDPDVIAADIIEDLQTALDEMSLIYADLTEDAAVAAADD